LKVGVGVSVPFGLKTEYDPGWLGRFQAIKSDVKTFNINPSGSYKINEMVSVGFGLSYQKIDAELTNKVLNPTTIEPLATVKAATILGVSTWVQCFNLLPKRDSACHIDPQSNTT